MEETRSYESSFFEIQDLNSSRTSEFFQPKSGDKWWDACAGSGGKSLLLPELVDDVYLFATDTRENILRSYSSRLRKSGFHSFDTQLYDVSLDRSSPNLPDFDGIIADVPCSGSGTWGRSPEWNTKEQEGRINAFVNLQRRIVSRLSGYLKSGRPLIYITCSVFKSENEENIFYFENNCSLELEKTAYLKGFDRGADTLFVARFIRK